MTANEWTTTEHALGYLARADALPHRTEGEAVLLEHVPTSALRILDLGTGDGRLLALLRIDRPQSKGLGLDVSEPMLAAARERFAGDEEIELLRHDMAEALPELGSFDAIVSCFAIHHLEDERKRSLYAEVFERLEPGGVFGNLEHVASPTERLHRRFYDALGYEAGWEDPSNRLVDVETQLGWLRELGFEDVDCYWKWLEMALLIGVKPRWVEAPPRRELPTRRRPDTEPVGQFHWQAESHLDLMHAEVPDYERLQNETAKASRTVDARSILELGTGTGETARRVLTVHPHAHLTGIDSSADMLAAARAELKARRTELRLGRLEDPLPAGPFDLVVSALAVHHLPGDAKADLFVRAFNALRPGGRFVLADVVVPEQSKDGLTPISPDYDFPSAVADQLPWLTAAGFSASTSWLRGDLAVMVADRPPCEDRT